MTTSSVPQVVRDGTRLQLTAPTGLAIVATSASDDGILDDFYADYDKAFIIESEKEGYRGFVECLALNSGDAYARLAARFGPFREYVIVASDQDTGRRIGGANLIVYPIRPSSSAKHMVLSININYIFIDAASRGRGYFKQLLRDFPLLALCLFRATNAADVPPHWSANEPPATFVFVEQNDPFRMPAADYQRDTQLTGLDQLARIGIWARLGAKIIDFPYVQPALSPTQVADDNLVFAVLGPTGSTLDACLLHEHLERFFGISVLKGREPLMDDVAGPQLAQLRDLCLTREEIRLLAAANVERASRGPPSLRSFLSR